MSDIEYVVLQSPCLAKLIMPNEQLFHIGIKALITNNRGVILLLKVNPAVLKGNQHGIYFPTQLSRLVNA